MIYHGLIDKKDWGEGPWMAEPDFAIWEPPSPKMICVLSRADMGHLCGYAGIPVANMNDLKRSLLTDTITNNHFPVHGGVTFNGSGNNVRTPEDADVDWIKSYFFQGFDCAHMGDLSFMFSRAMVDYLPYLPERLDKLRPVYRDWDYCKSQCEFLASHIYSCGRSYLG